MARRRARTIAATARGPRRPTFPPHLQTTPEAWRALKRQEWREVQAAFARFCYGCAFVPGHAEVWKMGQLVEQIEGLLQGDWVAW